MDPNPNHPHDDTPDDTSQPAGEEPTGIVPAPDEPPAAPPLDIDERGGEDAPREAIQLPDSHGWSADAADQIDEHQPLPIEGEYHDDDSVAPDPYNVDDQVDLHMPLPTRDPEHEVDDASTSEELDVDTALGTRGDAGAPADRVRFAAADGEEDLPGERVYAGGPGDDDAINRESAVFEPERDDDTTTIASGFSAEEAAPIDSSPEPGPTPAEPPAGITICPVCDRETADLRFCSHCGAALPGGKTPFRSTTLAGRAREGIERLLEPLGHWTRAGGVRFIMVAGGLLVLLALLANSGALALMIGAAIVPLILIYWCVRSDVLEREPLYILAGVGLAGTLAGAILGWLGALIVAGTWFDTGVLNYGAANLGGAFAEAAGVPPFLAWSLVGVVFPLLALVAIVAVPLAMRQTVSLRSEMMDGLTLGALMGAGVSLGSAIVFAAPMLTQGGPVSDASAWTLTIIGLTIVRPLVWTFSGGLLGAAVWRYMLTNQIGRVIIPTVVGAAGILIFNFVSIQLSASGLWVEVLWGVIVAIVVSFFYMRALNQAVTHDRGVLGKDSSRAV